MAKSKIKLQSQTSLQELLQDVSNMAYMQINEINDCVNALKNSTKLSDESMEGKTKYSKALHDFMTDKDRAYKILVDVGKLMNEVLKKGDEKEALKGIGTKDGLQLTSGGVDVDELRRIAEGMKNTGDSTPEVKTYQINGIRG